ncbi:TraB/GumN family protein [Kiloniella laminariae]|uniref:TraB/GumN family protein n=1 Tax=Kiloniella laminariae TaxID=454162 RepID=A0ABT4LIJ0_9PROT|nr:TraB/GumN family protein [Kiloniella laminariae]MCZ4279807.1 TraB/GumN family protein [Kiloniella laminariae]
MFPTVAFFPVKASAARRIQHLFRPLLVLLLGAGLASGIFLANLPTATATEAPTPGPALWKVSDADSEIWIFGTIHVLPPEVKWRSPVVQQAFAAADSLYIEAPVGDATPENMQPLIQRYGINHSGRPFADDLSPEARSRYQQVLQFLKLPPETMDNFAPFRPWLAGITLVGIQMQQRGYDPEAGVDRILLAEAKSRGLQLGYFESLEQQLALFGDIPPDEELAMFEELLGQILEEPTLVEDMIAAWKAGDIATLSQLLNDSFGEDERTKTALLYDRNKDWAGQISQILAGSGKTFIAVGAGHLGGERSLQWYLGELGINAMRQ